MPKKLCNQIGCSNIISYEDRYCVAHARNNDKTATTKHYDKNKRNQERSRFYHSAQWNKLRDIHLQKEPLCIICQDPGEIVDHIKEIEDGGCATCLDNLQTLCKPCHNTKTSIAAKARKQ